MDSQENANELMSASKAFLDEERLRITGLLAVEGLNSSQIAGRLGMQPDMVARHLEILSQMGLVQENGGVYRLDVAALNALSKRVLADRKPQVRSEDFEGDEYDRKVLKDYMLLDGRLKQIPSQHKKLLVILHHLAKLFKPGERYSEKEVNEILKKVNVDYAALRRYLVDEGFMQREKGIYWRTDN